MDVGDIVVPKDRAGAQYSIPLLFIVDSNTDESGREVFKTCNLIYYPYHVTSSNPLKITGSYCEEELFDLKTYLELFGELRDCKEKVENLIELITKNFNYEYSKHRDSSIR